MTDRTKKTKCVDIQPELLPVLKASLEEKFIDIFKDGLKYGKYPLLLFGAKGTPVDINEYEYVKSATSDKTYKGVTLSDLGYSDVRLPRPLQARLFSDLQKSPAHWKIFCQLFIIDWLIKLVLVHEMFSGSNEDESMYANLRNLFPHVKNGKTTLQRAYVMTTNFDGCIPEFLDEYPLFNEEKEKKTLVLNDSAKIRLIPLEANRTIGNKGESDIMESPWIITLRGDVYHTVCTNKLCSNGDKEISIYDAVNKINKNSIAWGDINLLIDRKEHKIKKWHIVKSDDGKFSIKGEEILFPAVVPVPHEIISLMQEMLCCPECRGERTLTISFPGLEQKEQVISEIMTAAWTVFGSNISLLCTVGFSGDSDRELVANLCQYALHANCNWFHITRKGGSMDTAVIRQGKALLPKDKFTPLDIGTGGLSTLLKTGDDK